MPVSTPTCDFLFPSNALCKLHFELLIRFAKMIRVRWAIFASAVLCFHLFGWTYGKGVVTSPNSQAKVEFDSNTNTITIVTEDGKRNLQILLASNITVNPGIIFNRTVNKENFADEYTIVMSAQSKKIQISLKILSLKGDSCTKFVWGGMKAFRNSILEDCIRMDPIYSLTDNQHISTWWYGGAELFQEHYASTSSRGNKIDPQPFLSSDIYSIAERNKLGGVLEAFWLNSNGWTVRVDSDRLLNQNSNNPLWISFNVNTTHQSKSLCLGSDWSRYVPAEVSSKLDTSLRYTVCHANTLKEAYTKQVLNRIDYDNGSP